MLPPLMPKPLKARALIVKVPQRKGPRIDIAMRETKSLRVLGAARQSRPLTSPPRVLVSKGTP